MDTDNVHGIRILEVVATLKRAGAERMVVSLASGLDRGRFETAVVSLYDAFPNGFEPVLADFNVQVCHLGKKRGFDPRMYGRLRGVMQEFRPDVIHTHSYVLRYTLPVASCAMVHTVHNVARQEVDRLGRLIHRIGFRKGVVPVAVGREVAQSFVEVYRFTPSAVIPNGIDTARFFRPEVRDTWRAANGFTGDDVLVVSVARLEPQKNPRALVEAFGRAATPRAHLLLVGDGSLRDQIRGDRVHLLGVRTDVPELLSAADVFALSSAWEGHPLAVMEAMAAGLPVIATAVGGVPEIVSNDAGVLVEPGEFETFAAQLHNLLTDAGHRHSLGQAARIRAREFDVRTMVERYERLFEEVVKR